MSIKCVIAIVSPFYLETLEATLRSLHVEGMTLLKARGFGEYKNLYASDWLSERVELEIFVEEAKVDALVDAILRVTHDDVPGAGIVAVMPVEKFIHLRTPRSEVQPENPVGAT